MGMQSQYMSSLTDKYLKKIRIKSSFTVSHLAEKHNKYFEEFLLSLTKHACMLTTALQKLIILDLPEKSSWQDPQEASDLRVKQQ